MQMIIENENYIISFIEGFDEVEDFEIEDKGYLAETILSIKEGKKYKLIFYDSTRFKQTVDNQLLYNNCYYEENIVMLKSVNLDNIKKSLEEIYVKSLYQRMIPLVLS